jgi:hypothetical protein
LREREREALERGELSAADLMRGGAWEVRAKAEAERQALHVARAKQADAAAAADLGRAQTDVIGRKAELDVIEKDRQKWSVAEKRCKENAEEEAAEEAWRPRTR